MFIKDEKEGDSNLLYMPTDVQQRIVKDYLFEDFFLDFRLFFNPLGAYKDGTFTYAVAFHLEARQYLA